jgi:hypothetical protein
MKNICIIPPGAKNTVNNIEKQDLSTEQHSYLYRPQTDNIPEEIREYCFRIMIENKQMKIRKAVNMSILNVLGSILMLLSIASIVIVLHTLAIIHNY